MANDLIERFQNQAASIDSIWNMFLFVHAALLASLYFSKDDRGLTTSEILIVLVAYGWFVYINTVAFRDAYHIMQAIVSDITHYPTEKREPFLNSFKKVSETDYSASPAETVWVHIVAAIIFAASLWRKKKSS